MTVGDRRTSSLTEDGRYRLLIDAITDYAIYMLDASGFVTSWNPGARRFKGYEASEVLGKHFSIFYTDKDQADGLPGRALEASARDGTFESEGWRLRKDGSRFWAHVVIDPVRDQSGELLGFAKITRDLSQQQSARDVFRPSEDQFRFLVQSVMDCAICLLDAEGLVSSWNQGAQRIKGYSADEVIGRHFSIFFTEEDGKKGEPGRALEIAAREGRFEKKEGWRVRKGGNVFLADVVISPVPDDSGKIIGFAKVTRDVSDARKAQQELRRAREALFQSQKMETVGQLTGEIAHDFNDILMAVLGGLEIVHRRLPEDPNITPLLENAIQVARRGKSLTQRMLAFARRQDSRPETIDLPVLFQSMMDLLQRSLGPSIVIEVRFPNVLGAIHADPNQLELVILNLVMNARDAMPEGGSILIEGWEEEVMSGQNGIARSGCFVCLSITHQRAEQTLSRATDPFFMTKGARKCTALGLSIVQGFAEQCGGQFIVKSRKGEGAVAELWLPVAAGPAKARSWPDEVAAAERLRAELQDSRPRVVLAVDDDRLVLMDTTAMLNSLGHKAYSAMSGDQALDIIRREDKIDLVIIDHAMPEMTGAELAEAIRMEWPNLPIIFTTPLVDASLQQLAKPLRAEELSKAIARLRPPILGR